MFRDAGDKFERCNGDACHGPLPEQYRSCASANPHGFSRETLDAMADSAAGRVIGPFDTSEEMWDSIFKDEE